MENTMNKTSSETKDRLIDDFNSVVNEAEQVLKSATREGSEKTNALLNKVSQNLKVARERFGDLQDSAVQKTKSAAKATDHYVHEHPWQSIGVAVALGVVIGLLLNRR
jgi:ElaB/YqjD/DUF883 family membrane-anchored ribosome-binding protein